MDAESSITVVRVACEWCGPIQVSPDRVRILLGPNGPTYTFTCMCGKPTVRRASPKALDALRRLGCTEHRIVLPPRISTDAPPITMDDLLDMHLSLRTTGWEHELFA